MSTNTLKQWEKGSRLTFIWGLKDFARHFKSKNINCWKHKHLLFYFEKKKKWHSIASLKFHTLCWSDSQHSSGSNCQLSGNPPVGGDNGADLWKNGWMPQRDIPGSAGITKRRWPLADRPPLLFWALAVRLQLPLLIVCVIRSREKSQISQQLVQAHNPAQHGLQRPPEREFTIIQISHIPTEGRRELQWRMGEIWRTRL